MHVPVVIPFASLQLIVSRSSVTVPVPVPNTVTVSVCEVELPAPAVNTTAWGTDEKLYVIVQLSPGGKAAELIKENVPVMEFAVSTVN